MSSTNFEPNPRDTASSTTSIGPVTSSTGTIHHNSSFGSEDRRIRNDGDLLYHERSGRQVGPADLVVLSFLGIIVVLTELEFCWKVMMFSFHATWVYSIYMVSSSSYESSDSKLRARKTHWLKWLLFILLLSWDISITPLHVVLPNLMDAWSSNSLEERSILKGIDVVYDPGDDAVVDVYAIHGLGSDPAHSWTYKGDGNQTYWLKDLLPKTEGLENMRVAMANHHTHWHSQTARLTFRDHALSLLEDISSLHSANPERPVIFIAHSFGGLLLKKTLLLAKANSNSLSRMTKGVLFLGTPHEGSQAAFWASCLSCLAYFRGSSTRMLEFMSVDSTALVELESEFYETYVAQGSDSQPFIYDIMEMRPEKLGKLVMGSIVSPRNRQIRHGRVANLDTDHRGLNKFRSLEDPNFQRFVRIFRQVLEYALIKPKPEPSSIDDDSIRNRNTKDEAAPQPLGMSQEVPWAITVFMRSTEWAMAELAASWIAKDMTKRGDYLSRRIPYMAVLAPLANAPFLRLSDYILFRMNFYQRRIVTRILWIVANNFILAPFQIILFIIIHAVIAGARTFFQIRATVRAGLMPGLKVLWILSLTLLFVSEGLLTAWWHGSVSLALLYVNALVKKKRLAALRRKYAEVSRLTDFSSAGRTFRKTRNRPSNRQNTWVSGSDESSEDGSSGDKGPTGNLERVMPTAAAATGREPPEKRPGDKVLR